MSETTWDYTVQDFSPLLTYSGSSDASGSNLDSAWQQSCPVASSSQLQDITICDMSSTHMTNVLGASVSFSFYGQSVQLFGNVTAGMEYTISIDGTTSSGAPVGATLASISNLMLGYHNVSLVAQPPGVGSGATLLFESAVVTVGTGLIGANVTRTILQNDDASLVYQPPSNWNVQAFDKWGIQHTASNLTWHQLNTGDVGSLTVTFTGSAILGYGPSWSFFPSTYRVSLDGQEPTTYFGNASMPDSSPGRIFIDGIRVFQPNPSGSMRALTIDNDFGAGHLGIDYFEVITVSGGSPIGSATVSGTPEPGTTVIPTTTASLGATVTPGISSNSSSSSSSGSGSESSGSTSASASTHGAAAHVGVIIGSIIGSIALLSILGFVLYRIMRRRRRQRYFNTLGEMNVPSFDPNAMVRNNPDTRGVIF